MLKAIWFCCKLLVFSVCILVLGNWIHWNGRTLSDQVRLQMSHAEHTHLVGDFRHWAGKITQDAQKGIQKKMHSVQEDAEEIPVSEKQKLRALIQELNSSSKVRND